MNMLIRNGHARVTKSVFGITPPSHVYVFVRARVCVRACVRVLVFSSACECVPVCVNRVKSVCSCVKRACTGA